MLVMIIMNLVLISLALERQLHHSLGGGGLIEKDSHYLDRRIF